MIKKYDPPSPANRAAAQTPSRQADALADSSRGRALIGADATFEGRILNAAKIEVLGEIRGEVAGTHLQIHEGGRVFGNVNVTSAEIAGVAHGEVHTTDLCSIRATGDVVGDVRYGRVAMAEGANLEAHLRNIPPELGGDFQIEVARGGVTAITTSDIAAFDPDDAARDLVFTASNIKGGHLALTPVTDQPVARFTQADLEGSRVCFKSSADASGNGSFDVVVRDASGATSGKPQTVAVKISG